MLDRETVEGLSIGDLLEFPSPLKGLADTMYLKVTWVTTGAVRADCRLLGVHFGEAEILLDKEGGVSWNLL